MLPWSRYQVAIRLSPVTDWKPLKRSPVRELGNIVDAVDKLSVVDSKEAVETKDNHEDHAENGAGGPKQPANGVPMATSHIREIRRAPQRTKFCMVHFYFFAASLAPVLKAYKRGVFVQGLDILSRVEYLWYGEMAAPSYRYSKDHLSTDRHLTVFQFALMTQAGHLPVVVKQAKHGQREGG